MKNSIHILILIVSFLSLTSGTLLGQNEAVGTSGSPLFRIAIGARQAAMGEAFSALSNDVNSLFYNPAGITDVEFKQFSVHHNSWLTNTNISTFAIALPTGKGTLGFGLNYFNEGTINEIVNGIPTGDNQAGYDVSLTVGYGYPFHKYLHAGLAGKFIQSQLADSRASSMLTDFGFRIPDVKDRYSFGFSLQDIGTKTKFEKNSDTTPITFRAGVAVDLLKGSSYANRFAAIVAADIVKTRDNDRMFGIGGEVAYRDLLVGRIGYIGGGADELDRFTVGGGVKFSNYSFDYAYQGHKFLDESHRISLSLFWGEKRDKVDEEMLSLMADYENVMNEIEQERNRIQELNKQIADAEADLKSLEETPLLVWESDTDIRFILPVHFAFNRSLVRETDKPKLAEVAKIIKTHYHNTVITIEGHTDDIGPAIYNKWLSKQRAGSVKDYLVNTFGLDSDYLRVVGYGEESPIADNTIAEGRRINRRVEFSVLK